jgi:GNAT superfamily N-acetyltransferase
MTLEIVDASEERLQDLFDWSAEGRSEDAGCRFCLYWEEPDKGRWPAGLDERAARKEEWFRRVTADVGACGKLAFLEGELAAYAQFAPPAYLPTAADYACGPPSEDALFVACLYVHGHRREGIGSAVLEGIACEAQARAVAVESFARKGSQDDPSGPLAFWRKHGFRVVREDDRFALVRKEPQ